MDSSTDRPEKLYAVHLPFAGCWMAISSEQLAHALEETYEVVQFTEPVVAESAEEKIGALYAAITAVQADPVALGDFTRSGQAELNRVGNRCQRILDVFERERNA